MPKLYGRGQQDEKIERARAQLATDIGIQGEQSKVRQNNAQAFETLNRAPARATRIAGKNEFPGVPQGTEIRQVWDARKRQMVDEIDAGGKPIISKERPAERMAASEIKYNRQGHALLVNKDGSGKSSPIFEPDGVTPLTKERAESGNIQTGVRLADDGITQIKIEHDGERWRDSLDAKGQPIIVGRVGKIDTATGAPVTALITDTRARGAQSQAAQESSRKGASYSTEAAEWTNKETTYRKNKTAEDAAIASKTEKLAALHNEKPSANLGLTGGTRTQAQIDTDKARLVKELETHRANATHFQTEADKAASSATEARRNAGLHGGNGGASSVIGRAPARDGKHHYTTAEIRSQAEEAGVTYEALLETLKKNPRVVIN
jgi:hypothetical protein